MVISNVPRIEKAYAKLNLYLDVLRLRDDNYQQMRELRSFVMYQLVGVILSKKPFMFSVKI